VVIPVRHATVLPLVAAGLAALACNANVPPQWRVRELRILAIRSEVVGSPAPPLADGDSGDTVRITALIANPLSLTPFRVRFATCLPSGTDALPPCLDPSALRDVDKLLASPGVVQLGDGVAAGPYAWAITVNVPDLTALFEQLIARAVATPGYQCRLYLELPVVVVADAGDDRQLAVKRVRLTPRHLVAGTALQDAYVPNRDPQPLGAWFVPGEDSPCQTGTPIAVPCSSRAPCVSGTCGADGFCAAAIPVRTGFLCAIHDGSSVGAFNQCAPDGTRTLLAETLDWQWYATDGDFPDADVFGNATATPEKFIPPAGPFTIWTIVRDGRGGEGWIVRDVPGP
jgi:hypothetical protein